MISMIELTFADPLKRLSIRYASDGGYGPIVSSR